MDNVKSSTGHLKLLSTLLFAPDTDEISQQIAETVSTYTREDLAELWSLANSHHVIQRAFPRLQLALSNGKKSKADRIETVCWIENAMLREQSRIDAALSKLAPICRALKEIGHVIVMKSLDHWPDLGNDLDLFSDAESPDVVAIMQERFKATLEERSWGDRLAGKWNFVVPGLPELVEVHVGRLGQTGEQVAITESLVKRAAKAQFGQFTFRVPAPEDRVIISTLQRMYRHFYLRLCDIADNARLIDSLSIDYVYLRTLARSAGLWDGLASYLVVVGEYVESYSGEALPLPSVVREAASLGNEHLSYKRKFLRIPIFPQAMGFYAAEWRKLLSRGELQNALRLSLLPGLAAAAALQFKIAGNDKGIW
jgi:hypothetical protein